MIVSTLGDHIATIRGLLGVAIAESFRDVAPFLTVIVLILTAINLLMEIRKKSKKD